MVAIAVKSCQIDLLQHALQIIIGHVHRHRLVFLCEPYSPTVSTRSLSKEVRSVRKMLHGVLLHP